MLYDFLSLFPKLFSAPNYPTIYSTLSHPMNGNFIQRQNKKKVTTVTVNFSALDQIQVIYRRLLWSRQLGGLVPVFRLGFPLRCKASKLEYPLRIPPFVKKITIV